MKRLGNFKALLLVFVAALTLEATALVQFYFSQKGMRKEADLRAESQLDATRNQIMDVIDQAEAAVRNSVWIAQWCLDYPDSLVLVCRRLVEDNPVVVGSTVALVPGYKARKPLFAPYVFRNGEELQTLSLATPEYDYPSKEWFTKPVELGEGYWSEPYVDEGGGDMLMTTFSIPIKDKKGRVAAVLTADISLDWLKEMVGGLKVYPNAYCLVYSRGNQVMVGPPITDETDTTKFYIYRAPVERTGWSLSTVIPDEDIYGSLRQIGGLVFILQLLGLVMIILMLRSFIKGEIKYKALDQKRQRIEGELHIATGIQMSMVPKTFPPFPERHDLDMAATIVPAKEVGGDLYDFFIRDEKLFFCVGDVSGKGVPAALVMAVTRTTFRNLSALENSPGRIVKAMNDNLSAMNESDMFVTFFCGVLDLSGGHLRYCNAGHNPPMILTDAIQPLPVKPNLPLGIMGGFDFQEQEVPFHYDDALFLYTDGLTEAENAEHEQFGEQRMQNALHGHKSAQEHLDNIKEQVAAFVDGAPQSDDLTVLFIHYLPTSLRLTLPNEIGQISQLPGFVEEAVKAAGLEQDIVPRLNLALEEAVTNVIDYAYPPGILGKVELRADIAPGALTFTLLDGGVPFDPTARGEVDINASVEDRQIGGLGIHLVRQIMDEVKYERVDDKNVLILTKKY
ncbi:MAG: SpoIIE family protein phosphatase [Bacteroidales bacterium]|nr:SpoIIE family protein phosphatase [Bacteroidales bacterium]